MVLHVKVMEEKLRLLESQVAGLISDVTMLKAWKDEMSKHCMSFIQPEAVVPTSDLKQDEVATVIIETTDDQRAAEEISDMNFSSFQASLVPTVNWYQLPDVKQDQDCDVREGTAGECSDMSVNDTITETANDQTATEKFLDMSVSKNHFQIGVPTADAKQEQDVSDTIIETVDDQKATEEYSDPSISSIQIGTGIPTSDVKQDQDDFIMETENDQETADCSDVSISNIQIEPGVSISDIKQDQDVSDTRTETANHQEKSDSKIAENLNCTSFANTDENCYAKKYEDEAPNFKCEIPKAPDAVFAASAVVDTQKTAPETVGSGKECKVRNSWIELIEEEEETASSIESVSKPESHDTRLIKTGNKLSAGQTVFEKLLKTTSKSSFPEQGDKGISKEIPDRQKTDMKRYKAELNSSQAENQTTTTSPDKQNSMVSSTQTEPKNTPNKLNELEGNAVLSYMLHHQAVSKKAENEPEEEQLMQDESVNIKEKNCPVCQCKIQQYKDAEDSEEDDVSQEMVKKMSREKLQKKYLNLSKRHQKLINAICDPSTLTLPNDEHALLNAARDGNIEEAIFLTFSPSMMDFRDEDGYAPLHLAVWNDHINMCKLLLAYNMPINVQDKQGNMPLHFAARKGNEDMCKMLLDWRAPLNASNTYGTTPLHCAAKEGHSKVCFLLLSKGALVNQREKWNNTALHMAACNGYLEICHMLIKNGAELNVQNSTGNTPLYNACRAGHFEVVQYLVKKGASLKIKCKKGKTPIDVVDTIKHRNISEWITEWEKHICTDLNSILVNLI